jgi:hypothetical protein
VPKKEKASKKKEEESEEEMEIKQENDEDEDNDDYDDDAEDQEEESSLDPSTGQLSSSDNKDDVFSGFSRKVKYNKDGTPRKKKRGKPWRHPEAIWLPDEREFKCPLCPKKMKTKPCCREHILLHDPANYIHMCDKCSERFVSKRLLFVHRKKMHEGEFAFGCRAVFDLTIPCQHTA